MTADQIERKVEYQTNSLDAGLMSGRLTQAEYDIKMRALDRWADAQHRRMERAA